MVNARLYYNPISDEIGVYLPGARLFCLSGDYWRVSLQELVGAKWTFICDLEDWT